MSDPLSAPPDLAAIVEMTDEEVDLYLLRYGVTAQRQERLMSAIERATARIVGADAPDVALVEQVMRAAQNAVRGELANAAKEAARDAFSRELGASDDTIERWITMEDDRVCPSCEERHGETHTHAEWIADGPPGSSNLICNGRCRCWLVPDDAFDGRYVPEGDLQVTVTMEVVPD